MEPEVARALRDVLTSVVENGTASRLAHVFATQDGTPIAVGGKQAPATIAMRQLGREVSGYPRAHSAEQVRSPFI